MLDVQNVTKRFGGLTAVNDVSVHVNRGEILGIIGPNGAGKTTLLNCINGYYRPEQGKIIFDGHDIVKLDPCQTTKRGIGRTFQIVRSFQKMTVLENVCVAAAFGGRYKKPEERARELLDFVSFPLDAETPVASLNIIQLKRLELARVLATNCKLLLLDEVAAGLTPSELPDYIKLIRSIRDQGITIICIEHVMKFIMELSDKVMVLDFGKKIAEDKPEVVAKNPFVREAYLGKEHIS